MPQLNPILYEVFCAMKQNANIDIFNKPKQMAARKYLGVWNITVRVYLAVCFYFFYVVVDSVSYTYFSIAFDFCKFSPPALFIYASFSITWFAP